jgi:hypothetical protein
VYVVGFALIAVRSPATVGYWHRALWGIAALLGVRVAILIAEHHRLLAHPLPVLPQATPGSGGNTISWPLTLERAVVGMFIPVLWWLYWSESKRVAETFPRESAEPEMAVVSGEP